MSPQRLCELFCLLLAFSACTRDFSADPPDAEGGMEGEQDADAGEPDAALDARTRDASDLDAELSDASEASTPPGADASADGAPAAPPPDGSLPDGGPPLQCGALACLHGGACSSASGAPTCVCPAEWRGSTCDQDVDECQGAHGCPAAHPCENLPGGYTCAGELADFPLPRANVPRAAGEFERSASGRSVLDKLSGLQWQAQIREPASDWASALAYCAGLSLDGHEDWRLPSLVEHLTLFHGVTLNDYVGVGKNGQYVISDLSNSSNLNLWSASLCLDLSMPAAPADYAFYAYYGGAWDRYADSGGATTAFTRCVRRGQVKCVHSPLTRFTKQNGTVRDACTGLTWAESPSPTAAAQPVQAAYCASLTLAGRSWRLPSFLELVSTYDGGRTQNFASAFISVAGCYASSTPIPGHADTPSPPPYAVLYDMLDWDTSQWKPECLARCVSGD